MALPFLVAGLNGFLNFIPPPKEPMSENATLMLTAFMKSGYMFQLIAGTQLVSAILLLVNRFVPLALALIAPVVVNIVMFHIFLEPKGLGVAIFILILELYLAWSYRAAFIPMLGAKNSTVTK